MFQVSVSILARESDISARRTLEALWIAAKNPQVNRKDECIAITQELAPFVELWLNSFTHVYLHLRVIGGARRHPPGSCLENAILYDEMAFGGIVSLMFSTFPGSEEGEDAETSAEATGPCDKPAYEDPCHITWLMTLYEYRDSATASAGADAHSQSPASVERQLHFINENLPIYKLTALNGFESNSNNAFHLELPDFTNFCTVIKQYIIFMISIYLVVLAILMNDLDEPFEYELRIAEQPDRETPDEQNAFEAPNKLALSNSSDKEEPQEVAIPIEVRNTTTSGVGIIVFERSRDSIVSVERFDDRLMKIVVAAKERLYHLLDEKTAEVPSKDVIIVAGDFNGHVVATKEGNSCHGGFGYGSRNADGERILEYAESHNLTIVNTIDFVLVKDRDRSIVTDTKIVPYEAVARQRRPLVCTSKITPPRM
ncbi:unnamed protein product [Heligmosomoides polygyrus]|uniref:Endo/exonuclease/phosphatase domain-containing protein n=1 Tax=Heligmosomoides polygyrus TaxID=6339 RepID=A0A3P8AYC8_HELPZ|nr:unnamed protein product [Heligmosomoides polygyrus]